MLKTIKIVDDTFKYNKTMKSFHKSENIDFIKTKEIEKDELVIITDYSLNNVDNINGIKIAMLVEPRAINPAIYHNILLNKHQFSKILTYDKELLDIGENFEFYPHGGCWIYTNDHMVYNKSKLISIMVSNKSSTVGHKLRFSVLDSLKQNNIDFSVYGRTVNNIDYKLTALKDYAFSIVIENSKIDYYFTEKLIDSFITGTVPIYWGCPSIGDFFNLDGMIIFDNIDDLLYKIKSVSLDKYNSMLPAIQDNFERAKKYLTSEDWLYHNSNIFE